MNQEASYFIETWFHWGHKPHEKQNYGLSNAIGEEQKGESKEIRLRYEF